MVPYYLAGFPMQLFLLHHFARMLLMIEIIDDEGTIIEIIDDEGTMTGEIAMVIEEIKEVVVVVVVVDKSSGTKTKVRPVSPVSLLT